MDTTSSTADAASQAGSGATCTLTDLDGPASPHDERADLAEIRAVNEEMSAWTVVLDDDPTGTQTVSNVLIVMGAWGAEDLEWASAHDGTSWKRVESPGPKGWGLNSGVDAIDGTGPNDIWAFAGTSDNTPAAMSTELMHYSCT